MLKRVLLVLVLIGLTVIGILFAARNAIVSAIAESQANAHGIRCEPLALSLTSYDVVELAPTRCALDDMPGIVFEIPGGAKVNHSFANVTLVSAPAAVVTLEPRVEDLSHVAEALLLSGSELPAPMREPVGALARIARIGEVPQLQMGKLTLRRGEQGMLELTELSASVSNGTLRLRAGQVTQAIPNPTAKLVNVSALASRDHAEIGGIMSLDLAAALLPPAVQPFLIRGDGLDSGAPTYSLTVQRPAGWSAIEARLRHALSARGH